MQRREFIRGAVSGVTAAVAGLQVPLAQAASWSEAQPLPINTQEIYPTVHQGKLHVAGGIARRLAVRHFTNRTFAYDPGADSWQETAPLPEDLHHAALVSTGDTLLAIGGFNGAYTHIWRMRDKVYALHESGWVEHSTLPTPQAEGVATLHAGRVHVVTGQQPRGTANTKRSDHVEGNLHWYFEAGVWRNLAPIPTPRNSATGGWIGEQLVVTGGRTAVGNLTTTEIYDAKTERWHAAAPLPLPQAGTASVVVDGSLIVFGGEIFRPEAKVFAEVWRYDLASDSWSSLPDMPLPRHGLGAGLIGDRIYVVGGASGVGSEGTSDANQVLTI